MKNEQDTTHSETLRVAAPVVDAGINVCSEVMHALPDPADPDQAVIVNVPVLADGINYGDLVRLAPEDEFGVRRIVEVVVASGHTHTLAAVDDGEVRDLVCELERMFPAYALRIESAGQMIVSVSTHPDLDPGEVAGVIAAWLGTDEDVAVSELPIAPPAYSEPGLVSWS